jgi:hypothetical protein
MKKVERLEKRVTKLAGPETPEKDRAIVFETDLTYRVLQCLTATEQHALTLLLIDSGKEGVDPNNEAFLTKRPPEQQAALTKTLSRFRELEQEDKVK